MVQKKQLILAFLCAKIQRKSELSKKIIIFFRRDEQQAYIHIRLIRSIRVRFID